MKSNETMIIALFKCKPKVKMKSAYILSMAIPTIILLHYTSCNERIFKKYCETCIIKKLRTYYLIFKTKDEYCNKRKDQFWSLVHKIHCKMNEEEGVLGEMFVFLSFYNVSYAQILTIPI